MISRLFRTAFVAAIGAAVFAAVRKLTKPGDPLPAPATPTGGPWPPLRPEPGAEPTASTSTGSTAPPPTGRVTTPQSAPPAPAEAPGEAEGPAPADPTKAEPTKPQPEPTKPEPTEPAPPKADTAQKPTEEVGAPAVVPEPDGTPVADAPTPGAAPSTTEAANAPWVEGDDDGNCPDGYPIKGNLKSKIFHSPGQLNYDRTNPDRCYVDAASAEADGLRPAKR